MENGKAGIRHVLLAILTLAAGLGGCSRLENGGAGESGILRLVTWNVQALFDGDETGTEYGEYGGEAGWNAEKYSARLNYFSQAIDRLPGGGPDILALEEVENSGVLKDLAGILSKHGYFWTCFAGNPGAPLGVGVLSRFPFTIIKAHSFSADETSTPRPMLELWIEGAEGNPLVFFVCHWKSKLGGTEATEPTRRASARILLRRLEEIRIQAPETPVIIMGDLNESQDEFYRTAAESGASLLRALLPDDPGAAELAARFDGKAEFIVVSGERPPRPAYFPEAPEALYSPWEEYGKDEQAPDFDSQAGPYPVRSAAVDFDGARGSYYYNGAWERIDHFLLTAPFFDGQGWEFDFFSPVYTAPFTGPQGFPHTYNPRTGSGLSDHLPLMLVLKTF
jgi:endonuclease/exonuclease/phosphatase family metal-dependent hydrolase